MHCAKFIQILQNMSRAKINFENRCYKELSALGHWTPTHLVVVRKVMWEQLLRRRGQQPCANLGPRWAKKLVGSRWATRARNRWRVGWDMGWWTIDELLWPAVAVKPLNTLERWGGYFIDHWGSWYSSQIPEVKQPAQDHWSKGLPL